MDCYITLSLPITAPHSAVINSTPPFNYSARLPRSRSQWQRHQASRRCRRRSRTIINPGAQPENSGEGWKRGRSLTGEGGGTFSAPGVLFRASFPSTLPPGRIPRPNHSLLNNSACSSAVIWLFTGYWNMNNEGAEGRTFPYSTSVWVWVY